MTVTLYDGVAPGGVAASLIDALPLPLFPPRPLHWPVPPRAEAFLGCFRFVEVALGGVISGRSTADSMSKTSEGVCFDFFGLVEVGVALSPTSKPDWTTEGDCMMFMSVGSTICAGDMVI